MDTKIVLTAIIALLIGGLVGHASTWTKTQPQGHTMPDGTAMQGTMDMNGAMEGMMAGLEGKTGDAFDQAFLSEMSMHHQGAVEMAEAALANAKHEEIKTMANAIISAQTIEIQQMQSWKKSWYGQD